MEITDGFKKDLLGDGGGCIDFRFGGDHPLLP
jgi:hypothetical protein